MQESINELMTALVRDAAGASSKRMLSPEPWRQEERTISFQQSTGFSAISYQQFLNETNRVADWLERWEMQGKRVVIATRSAYQQSVSLLAAVSVGCEVTVLRPSTGREPFEVNLRQIEPAALIVGPGEVEAGLRYRAHHDVKMLQMSRHADMGLERVYL